MILCQLVFIELVSQQRIQRAGKKDLWFSTKGTILKKYDGDFKETFQHLYATSPVCFRVFLGGICTFLWTNDKKGIINNTDPRTRTLNEKRGDLC